MERSEKGVDICGSEKRVGVLVGEGLLAYIDMEEPDRQSYRPISLA